MSIKRSCVMSEKGTGCAEFGRQCPECVDQNLFKPKKLVDVTEKVCRSNAGYSKYVKYSCGEKVSVYYI